MLVHTAQNRFVQRSGLGLIPKLAIFKLEGIFIPHHGRHDVLKKVFATERIKLTDAHLTQYVGHNHKEIIQKLGTQFNLSSDRIKSLTSLHTEVQLDQFKSCDKSMELLPCSKQALKEIQEKKVTTWLLSELDQPSFTLIYTKFILKHRIWFDVICSCNPEQEMNSITKQAIIRTAMQETNVDHACFISDMVEDMWIGSNIKNEKGKRCVTTIGMDQFSAEGPHAQSKLLKSPADHVLSTMARLPFLDYFQE
jgi:phosphoglycolate phosphatase-like HAD superfamily hydrolase